METKSSEGLRDGVGSSFHVGMPAKRVSWPNKPLNVRVYPALGDCFNDLTESRIDAFHLRGALGRASFMPIAVA